ncbi:MAG: RluA family pseudouridine synthase [Deltaproteobacteria bacterium]|nr:RluA family pseudouridine synthase [Deltaproteobacteria bacterium]
MMEKRVLYQDNDLLIVNKPAGTLDPSTLLQNDFPEIMKVGGQDHGACHRLDRATSGLLVFARNEETYQKMREMFSKNKVKKEYLALVEGEIKKSGRINWPIGPNPKSSKRVKVYKNLAEARRNKGQEAVTYYAPLKVRGAGVRMTWLRVTLKTGRRHQIRAHLAAIGHPILGDLLYKGPPANRLYLHACHLEFKQPGTGKTITVFLPFSEGQEKTPAPHGPGE